MSTKPGQVQFTRFPLSSDRNVGSPTNDLAHCLYLPANPSRCEAFFWENKHFLGWQGTDNSNYGDTKSYHDLLSGDRFEYRGTDPGYGRRDPNAGNNFWAQIYGPTAASPGNTCYWSAETNITDAPSYQWVVNGAVLGTDYDFSYTAYSSFELQLIVSSPSTATQTSETINIDAANGDCFVQFNSARPQRTPKLHP